MHRYDFKKTLIIHFTKNYENISSLRIKVKLDPHEKKKKNRLNNKKTTHKGSVKIKK